MILENISFIKYSNFKHKEAKKKKKQRIKGKKIQNLTVFVRRAFYKCGIYNIVAFIC